MVRKLRTATHLALGAWYLRSGWARLQNRPMTSRRHFIASGLALLVTLASVAIVLLALDQAFGERVRPDGSCCDVEFINSTVLKLTWLLFPVLGVAAWLSIRVALVGILGMAVPQWLAMNETIDRYHRSGWADGLEVLGYALPLGVLVLAGLSVLVGGLLGRRRRHDR